MPIIFLCPHCRRKVKAEDKQAEQTLKCPNPACQKPVTIPKTADEWVKDAMRCIDITREAGIDNVNFHSFAAIAHLMASDREDLFERFLKVNTSMMFHAATGGYLEAMKWLKKKGVRIDEPEREGELKGLMPIHVAASCGHDSVVDWLLKQDETLIHAKGKNGRTPMHEAAATGQVDMMELLEERGGNVNGEADGGMKPIHSAAICDQTESLKHLVNKRGVSVNEPDSDGLTSLHGAAASGKIKSIKCLVEELNADVNAENVIGMPPLFLAAKLEQIEGMECLYKLCTERNLELKLGLQTLKRYAEAANLQRVIRWLDEKGIQ